MAWSKSQVSCSLWGSGRGPRSLASSAVQTAAVSICRRPQCLHLPREWVRETAHPVLWCPLRIKPWQHEQVVSQGLQEEPRGPDSQSAYLASAVGTSKHQIPAPGSVPSSQMGGGGPWQTPAALGLLPQILGAVGEQPGQASLGPGGGSTGVWSAVGDLYCEIVRTLSTNWNLKFQRGKTEGPYPTGEMALGSFPPRLLFFVLIKSWFSLPRAPHGRWRRKVRS